MAIYKVTDLKTDEVTTTSDLRYLYAKLHDIEDATQVNQDAYKPFETALVSSPDFQKSLSVLIEEVDVREAIKNVRKELDDAAEKQKTAKVELQKLTASALADVDDNAKAKETVEHILSEAKQSPVHVKKWFVSKKVNKKTVPAVITHVKLPKHVDTHMTTIAEEREANRSATAT